MGVKKALLKGLKDAAAEKKVAIKTEFEKAHAIAQKNAALPIEQGGLGLPENNTAMDRARAMGFDVDNKLYHGTNAEFDEFKPNTMLTSDLKYASNFASMRNKGNGGGNVIPVYLNEGKQWNNIDYGDDVPYSKMTDQRYETLINNGYDSTRRSDGAITVFDPSNIRSPNAAFDPLKRNSPNLLASAGAGAAVAGGALYTPEENQAQASMIGQAAKTFNKEALAYAKKLEAQGAPNEAIRKATGYQFGTPIHRGVDGKWRQEISDKGFSLDPSKLVDSQYGFKTAEGEVFRNNELAAAYPELFNEQMKVSFKGEGGGGNYRMLPKIDALKGDVDRHFVMLHDEARGAYGEGFKKQLSELTGEGGYENYFNALKDDFTEEQIKKYYSENVEKLKKNIAKSESEGYFSPNTTSTAAHELQHGVQQIEGFAKGGDALEFDQEIGSLQSKIYNMQNNDSVVQAKEWIDNTLDDILKMDVSQAEKSKLIKEMHDYARTSFPEYGRLRSMEDVVSKYTDYGSIDKTEAAYKAYRKLAGEEEARQTQKRLPLSMLERIERNPNLDFDTPPEQQIVRGQTGATTTKGAATLAALSGGANAIYNAAKNNTLGEAANYAQDAANMVGYIPTAGMMTTSDIIGGIGKAGAAATGNLDAYNREVSPYVERAGETQSQLGKQVEQAIGYGVEQAMPYVTPYLTPVFNNVSRKWEQIEANPGDANLFGFIDELNKKANVKLFR